MSEGFAADLHRFVAGLTHDPLGVLRPEAERDVLLAATRDMLSRLSVPAAAAGGAGAEGVFQAGQTVAGVFEIVAPISRGGLGELYRARHRELHTDHALKVLQAGFATDPNAVALLRNEARLLLMVRHDAVVGGQGLLRDSDGRPVLVMDYLRGPPLARLLRAGPLEPEAVLALGARVLAGLDALHRRGIVHGDISPGNIVLCDERAEGATLVDLGVGRLLTELRGPHDGLEFAGKYGWAAPEQLDPAGRADIRSDLYSLGLVLAAASGAALAMGTDESEARRRRTRLPPLDAVPPRLRPVLSALLQPAPPNRPADAGAAAALLAAAHPVKPRGLFGWSNR